MKFYNEKEPLYLKMDLSGVGLEAGMLLVREGIKCPCDEAPDKMMICP